MKEKIIHLRPKTREEYEKRDERLYRRLTTAILAGDKVATRRIDKIRRTQDDIMFDDNLLYPDNLMSPFE